MKSKTDWIMPWIIPWINTDKECTVKEFNPDDYYGFTYKITDSQGKVYFGRKNFKLKKKSKLSKKARLNTRKRVKIEYLDSNWDNYWGSCKELLQFIQDNGTIGFKREILKLCKTKSDLSYHENAVLYKEDVLFRKDTYNGHIGHYYKGKINP